MKQTALNPAVLKIGELAGRAGLTVRALHHFDSIGLLKPSARSASGYRLYNRADIARLHQIQALRRFGLPLADIGALLAQPGTPFAEILAQQIAALGRQIKQACVLRERLSQLQRQLDQGAEPELSGWLSTLELMAVYDKVFTPEELQRLPFYSNGAKSQAEWAALVAQVRALIDGGVDAEHADAQRLAEHWMIMLERDTAANPDFVMRIDTLLAQDAAAQQRTGITPQLRQYVMDAFSARRHSVYAKYLDEDEMRHMRANSGKRAAEWPPLIAAVQRQMDAGAAPDTPAVQALTRHWFELFRDFAGDRPATMLKIRAATEKEPTLRTGTWMSDDMLTFIRQSAATLQAAAAKAGAGSSAG
ncbi:MerR family transcriptional regulator [Rugamonas sp. CCM 8940]|uniref:MerR family transcriptional regulator n=1 Tax=Rugamonas sp. CCM 8940 TaxID=2765359 RepID=UPI0018F60CF8|nr:MerR family transcriptional regulator [Rugamonas sp. CCM 8940]MBJ7309106.1 MerR family transcriptional regulator [Rugamonas sp. CCM 8940]